MSTAHREPTQGEPRVGDAVQREARTCRRCARLVSPERHASDDGVTWLWRCECGWSVARTESGVVSRGQLQAAIALGLVDPGDGSETR